MFLAQRTMQILAHKRHLEPSQEVSRRVPKPKGYDKWIKESGTATPAKGEKAESKGKSKEKKGKDGPKGKGKGDGAANKGLSDEEKQKRLKTNPPPPEGGWPEMLTFNGIKTKYELCKLCLEGKECKQFDPNKNKSFIKHSDHWKSHELAAEVRRRQWQSFDSRPK